MIIEAREQVKSLLAIKRTTLKDLTEIISVKTGKTCTSSALSNKLRRGTITYNELIKIADYLGFKVSFDIK